MIKERKQLLIILLAFLAACIKPYDFDPQSFDKVLVIEGHISDEPGPHHVSINYTYPLDTVLNEFVNNAEVWVETDDGTRVDYTPMENGRYESPATFTGEVSKSYQLHVRLANGEEIVSEPETLLKSPEIDTIYGKYAFLPNSAETNNVGGLQVFIDSKSNAETKYLRYEWEEAYKIQTPYPALYRVAPDSSLVLLDTQIGICYNERFSNSLIYGTTNGTSENRLIEFPVRFVSQEEQALRTRYTILVKQYAISEAAYLFYKRLNENNESGGSLFDQQAGSVIGNITSTTDPEKTVLGYFEASGVSTKRRYFSRADLDDRIQVSGFSYICNSLDVVVTTVDSALYYVEATGGNIFAYDFFTGEVSIHNRGCTDCSFYADVTPPPYWEN